MIKNCAQCGVEFTPNHRLGPKRVASTMFCSRACVCASNKTISEKPCAACGEIFKPSNQRGKYCSRGCAASAHKGPVTVKGKGERYKRVAKPDGTRALEHRAVMEKELGRSLLPGENVHHKNGNRFDNTPENLELWYRGQPSGQRVDDLIAYIVKHHRHKLALHLSDLCGE